MSWTQRTIINKKHCSMCYCYVCEVKADECTDFERHCNASDRDEMKSYWKFQRSKKQESKRNRHFRFQCAVHIFRHNRSACPWPVEMWEQRSWFNKRFCRECVCFVCNKPVIDCTDWSEQRQDIAKLLVRTLTKFTGCGSRSPTFAFPATFRIPAPSNAFGILRDAC